MDSDVRVFNVNMDTIILDSSSPITIEDSEAKVIELEASCADTEVTCLDDENPIYSTKNIDRFSSSDIEAIEMTIHSREDSQSSPSRDIVPQPAFKVMFRDESVSRYVRLVRFSALFTTRAREFVPPDFTRMTFLTSRNVNFIINKRFPVY